MARSDYTLSDQLLFSGIDTQLSGDAVASASGTYEFSKEIELANGIDLEARTYPTVSVFGEYTTPSAYKNRIAWPWSGEDGLVLSYPGSLRTTLTSSPKKGRCLTEFIGLATVTDDEFAHSVLAFARRWGPLGICEHRMPSGHHRYDLCDPLAVEPQEVVHGNQESGERGKVVEAGVGAMPVVMVEPG